MFRRTLPKDAVLWWAGDPARSVALVEAGRVGVRDGGRLLDAVHPGSALGESALLAGGTPRARGVDVLALDEDTVVVEYDVVELEGASAEPVRLELLRALLGQIARNHLWIASAHSRHALLATAAGGALETLARCEPPLAEARSWDDFLLAARFLSRLREGTDAARRDVGGAWNAAEAESVLARASGSLVGSWLGTYLAAYVAADRPAL